MTNPRPPSDVVMSNDIAEVEAVDAASPFAELGVTGLKRTAGYIDEEFLQQLKGPRAVKIYREMRDNSSIVGALMFAITQLIKDIDYSVVPAGKGKEAADAARLLETCMDDMNQPWGEFMAEMVDGELTYGWHWNELVYKKRVGPWQKDAKTRSKYTDGMIGWRKLPTRGQETLQRWAFDESGDVVGMLQMGAPDYVMRTIPINKSLHFKWGSRLGNPEGRSILRNAYQPWFYLKRIEEFESIGIERDLAGLPKIGVPASYLSAPVNSPQWKQVQSMKKLVRGVRRNEQEGIVFPLAYDAETKQPLFTFELVGSGGARAFNTREIIDGKQTEMLMTVLADFIKVGHQDTGTYNMHVDKRGIFQTALNSVVSGAIDTVNRHAVPRLFAINGWRPAELPTIQPSNVDAPNIAELAQFLATTAGIGFNWADEDIEKYLRNAAGLPALSKTDEAKNRRYFRMQESTRFATAQTEYLAARSTLAQQTAAAQMQASGEPAAGDVAEAQGLAAQAAGQDTAANAEQRAQEQHETSQSAANQSSDVQLAQLAQDDQKPGQGSSSAAGSKPKPRGGTK